MMNKRLLSFSFILLAAITFPSFADNIYWTGLGMDDLWSNPSNWDVDDTPIPTDLVVIDLADSNCLFDNTITSTVNGIWVGFAQRPCYFDITGGSLTTANGGLGFRLGVDNGTGIVRMSGGDVTVNGDMAVGQSANGVGELEMTGGNITVAGGSWLYVGNAGSSGKIELKGGTLSVFSVAMNDDGVQNINITGDGQLIIRDPRPSEIEYQVLSYFAAPERKWITAYDGIGTLEVAVGPSNETIVTAIAPPECSPVLRADLTYDCIVDFYDFVIMAEEWLLCTRTDGNCPE